MDLKVDWTQAFMEFADYFSGGRFNHPLGYAELSLWIVLFYMAIFLIIGLFGGNLKPVIDNGILRIGLWMKNIGVVLSVPLIFLVLGLVVSAIYFAECTWSREVPFGPDYFCDEACTDCSGLLVKDPDGEGTRWLATMANTYGSVVIGFQAFLLVVIIFLAFIGATLVFLWLIALLLQLIVWLLHLVGRLIGAVWRFAMSYLRRIPVGW
jgi:hypothetical protein